MRQIICFSLYFSVTLFFTTYTQVFKCISDFSEGLGIDVGNTERKNIYSLANIIFPVVKENSI